ncbi:hypothetical protein B0T22DRAFT_447296 [Podospora appendiculata]|uniref:MAPEG family protein n=1 Tax=Podospora appendiculata TaxID=314037 RepID=A0AAE0XFF8_9PEZI|nr:hypothetical protein B0T22DRAFT_447296 [Podospora appendiculata]
MANIIDFSANWSYYTIPAAFVVLMVPHFYGNMLAGQHYDLANPRKMEEHVAKDDKFDKLRFKRIQRAKAAVANGFETIGLFAAGVVAANAAGAPVAKTNQLALGYLVCRAVFNWIYVWLQDNSRWAPVRSLTWIASMVCILGLFVVAGNAVY